MSKILHVAWRDFVATVMTKGFLIGLLMLPLMLGLGVLAVPWLVNQEKSFSFEGELLLLDPSARLGPGLRDWFAPEAFAERRLDTERRIGALMPAVPGAGAGLMDDAMDQALGEVPVIRIRELSGDADAADARAELQAAAESERKGGPFAVLQVLPAAFDAESEGPPYALWLGERVDARVADSVREGIRSTLVEARLDAANLDAEEIRRLMRLGYVETRRIDNTGEESSNEILSRILPVVFMVLLLVSVLSSGQMLMTSTIEEKSSRVVEVLLAAVSPMQLMAGKILAQGVVALLMLLVYGGLGLVALVALAASGAVKPLMLVYLLVYFVIAYLTIAALMAAIGAAVNELKEAQALLTPVMLLLILPMMLNPLLARDPNGTLATVLSLVPPVSPMVMVLRLSSNAPPPGWQVALSLAIGVLGVIAAVWLAGKVFRVGLLMYGKPPNLATLWRWMRMA